MIVCCCLLRNMNIKSLFQSMLLLIGGALAALAQEKNGIIWEH